MARFAETPFLERMEKEIIVGDGAVGSLLYARGVPMSDCFENLNATSPAIVRQIHSDYLAAGARMLTTNSFRGNGIALSRHGHSDQTHDLNKKAAELVKEVARGEAYVGGSVGPIGKRKLGQEGDPITLEDRRKIYAEQIGALVEGGADLILLETFLSLEDLLAAFHAARSVTQLPVVAQMAFLRNKVTYEGVTLEIAAAALMKAGADIIGANCGHGTIGAIQVAQELAELGAPRISAFPNMGFPDYAEGRYLYRTDPDYLARRITGAVDAGARLVGGCCGTGPGEIRTLVKKLAGRAPVEISKTRRGSVIGRPPQKRIPAAPITPATSIPGKHWIGKYPKQKIITVELDPPRAGAYQKVIDSAKLCKEAGADAISIADNPLAIVRMSNMALGHLVQSGAKIPVIMHIAGRDRNLIGTRSELMGAAALGITTVFPITGDPSSIGDAAGATSVYDLNSFGLISLIDAMNKSESPGAPKGGFTIGAAYNPNVKNLPFEADRLKKKAALGAKFVQTQAVYDVEIARESAEMVRELNVPLIFGILPFISLKNAEFIAHEVPGITVPEALIERMREAKDPKAEGLAISEEIIEGCFEFAAGFYLLPRRDPTIFRFNYGSGAGISVRRGPGF